MSEETTTVAEPVDDAVVVHDPVVDAEKVHEELVADVTKLLDKTPGEPEKPDAKSEEAAVKGEDAKKEPEESPSRDEGLSQELQTRVKGAGLSEDLAQRLQQSGQLEETLAAFDRSMIDYVQSKESKDEPKESKDEPKDPPKAETEEPPPKDQQVPALDENLWDEDIRKDFEKLDAHHRARIDALESRLEELIEGQQGGFDEWMDGTLKDLGVDTSDNDKCQEVFKAYGAMCDAFGKNPTGRDKAMVQRAYAAMYPQEVFKQQQRQTVDRLRDASGKFLSSSNSKGGPPPKDATDEEVQEQLVSDVTAYLKERGVQMSGV